MIIYLNFSEHSSDLFKNDFTIHFICHFPYWFKASFPFSKGDVSVSLTQNWWLSESKFLCKLLIPIIDSDDN